MTPRHHPIAHVGVRRRFREQCGVGRFLRTVRDAAGFAGVILTAPLSRYPVRTRSDEGTRSLPGDDLLPAAKGRWTKAITSHARPREVWPWLVQMGCRRAGWYSYDGLDNGGLRSAGRIVPELQEVQVGDLFPWTPTAEDGVRPRADRARAGARSGRRRRHALDASTRLLTRASAEYEGLAVALRLRLFGHPVHFAMQRKQLLNLRRRVEVAAG